MYWESTTNAESLEMQIIGKKRVLTKCFVYVRSIKATDNVALWLQSVSNFVFRNSLNSVVNKLNVKSYFCECSNA